MRDFLAMNICSDGKAVPFCRTNNQMILFCLILLPCSVRQIEPVQRPVHGACRHEGPLSAAVRAEEDGGPQPERRRDVHRPLLDPALLRLPDLVDPALLGAVELRLGRPVC